MDAPSSARKALAAIAAAVLLVGGPIASPAPAVTRTEEAMHRLVNRARENHGRSRLRLSTRLSRLAHRHSRRMADAGTLFHHSCLSCLAPEDWSMIGENVGVGATIRSVHRALMHSSPHRRNILHRRYDRIGVGVVKSGGRVWVTEIFVG